MSDFLFTADSISFAVFLAMLGGFYLAGFFKAQVFNQAPDRSGVVKGTHLLMAAGLMVPQIWVMTGFAPKSVVTGYAGFIASVCWPAALFFWMWLGLQSPDNAVRLGLRGCGNARSARVGLWGIPIGLIMVCGVGFVGTGLWILWGKEEPTVGHEVFKNMQEHPHDVGNMAAQGVSAILVAPFFEEAMFRGLLLTGLQSVLSRGRATSSRIRWVAVIVVGILFGAVHLGAASTPMLPALAAFGILLGWAYEYTGCFWVPVAIHMGFNAVSFAAGVWQIRASVQ